MTFTGTMAKMPEGTGLKARLAWKFFFDGGWVIVKAGDWSKVTDNQL